jgi:peptide/nickel transport system ATP-binding protein
MPYTLGLLGSLPRLDRRTQDKLTPIPGAPPSLISLPPGCPFTPRCPMAAGNCEETEPMLQQAGPDHLAACHYHGQLVDVTPDMIFRPTVTDAHMPEEFGAAVEGARADEVESLAVAAADAAVVDATPVEGTEEGEQA